MFGLDHSIASLGAGQAFAIVAIVAILLGLRHATDPDHLTAVAAQGGDSAQLPNLSISVETYNETFPAFASGLAVQGASDVSNILRINSDMGAPLDRLGTVALPHSLSVSYNQNTPPSRGPRGRGSAACRCRRA